MEAIRTCKLVLRAGYILNLERTFYAPSFSGNLISISRLLSYGFSFNFVGTSFPLVKDNVIIGGNYVDNGLFKLDLNLNLNPNHNLTTMHGNIGIKHGVINEKASMLWHKRLGHIYIERIKIKTGK